MLTSYGKTDIGLLRSANEDDFYIGQDKNLYVLADGMGGYAAGDVASQTAVQTTVDMLATLPCAEESIEKAMRSANGAILQKVKENPDLSGMGTTLTVLWCTDTTAYWGHVGDSRLYAYTKGKLTQITTDHSLIQRWVQEGVLTPEEATKHPKRNILTRAIGVDESPLIDTGHFALDTVDRLLLCSDGLHSLVDDETIAAVLGQDKSDEDISEALLQEVYKQGAKDNITIITITLRAGMDI